MSSPAFSPSSYFCLSLSLFFSLALRIFSSPRFLAPHAFGVSIVSPCPAETQREARFGLESIDYPKKLLLRLRVSLRSRSISFPISPFPSCPCGTPGSVVGSARDNAAGTSIH